MSPIFPVVVEDDVWIGARVIILPGVTIGTGSILGAGSVVAHSVPAYSVVVGNPGTVVKCRKSS
jgi:maltose O-acetyltransferase